MTQWGQFSNKFLEDNLKKIYDTSGDIPTEEQARLMGEISKELFYRGAMTEELIERLG